MMSDLSFREDPFRLTPDQRLPYQSFAFQETFQLLIGALREGRGPVLLTGEAGTGKTLLLRVLKRELEQGGMEVPRRELLPLTSDFDRKFYGREHCAREDYDRAVEAYTQVRRLAA